MPIGAGRSEIKHARRLAWTSSGRCCSSCSTRPVETRADGTIPTVLVPVLASSHDFPTWAAALGVPVWLGGAAILIWLLLTRRIVTSGERDDALAALQLAHDAETAEVENRATALTERVEALVVDRDAWRDAHREEAAARRAAEAAAAALMESGQISLALLSALKDALVGGRNRDDHG